MTGQILFVAYGGGHMRMLVPVAQEMRDRGHDILLLPLTLGVKDAAASGLPMITLNEALADHPGFDEMLSWGRQIAPTSDHPSMSDHDTHVYHGMGFHDVVAERGETSARHAFAETGRKSFHPLQSWRWILDRLQPRAVVATNSPRSESACLRAAVAKGVPATCVTDHFLVYEIDYVSQPSHGHKITVLGDAIADFLIAHGRPAEDIVVTGNTSFDLVGDDTYRQAGAALRSDRGWTDKTVILWPQQSKATQVGGKTLIPPQQIAPHLRAALDADPAAVLVIRPHPNAPGPGLAADGDRVVLEPDPAIETLIHACDVVVQQSTTVGIQAALIGKSVITIANKGMPPFAEYGLARDIASPDMLGAALTRPQKPDPSNLRAPALGGAQGRIADVIEAGLGA